MVHVRPRVDKIQSKVKKIITPGDRGRHENKDAAPLVGPVLLQSISCQRQWLCTASEESPLLGAEKNITFAHFFCIKDPFAVFHPKLSAVGAQDSFLFDVDVTGA